MAPPRECPVVKIFTEFDPVAPKKLTAKYRADSIIVCINSLDVLKIPYKKVSLPHVVNGIADVGLLYNDAVFALYVPRNKINNVFDIH